MEMFLKQLEIPEINLGQLRINFRSHMHRGAS